MKHPSGKTFCKIVAILWLLVLFFIPARAQYRNYDIVYSDNARGDILIFGNTLMALFENNGINTFKMNDNAANGNSIYGNDFSNMQYVDVDGSDVTGIATRNSSTSDLFLSAGVNIIKLAQLYWGGRVKDSDFDLNQPANKKIKIRKGTVDNYTELSATQIDKNNFIQNGEPYTRYQAFVDITSFIKNNGNGTYSVGNAPLSTGAIDNGGNYGGWCIVVVYENSSLNYNSLRLYDGFQQVFNNGNPLSTSVTLTGLDVPSQPLNTSDAKMGAVTWEGDANLIGDYLKINGNAFSNNINQPNNPWNGTISTNGVHITTKTPNYSNQMGIDIDQFDVGTGYGIMPNATNVTLEFGTEADQYFPGIFSFVIKTKEPTITLDKFVTDANNNNKAEAGEILTYTLSGKNLFSSDANNVVITDTLPNTVTYYPNSLRIVGSPGLTPGFQTDASGDDVAESFVNGLKQIVRFRLGTGANSTTGGTLTPNESYEVIFKVTVNDPGPGTPIPAIINTARITASDNFNMNLTDDGTAIINPEAGTLPVSLVYFNASLNSNNKVNITWSTSLELNSKYFEVERSMDGNYFTSIAKVPGKGTTFLVHSYTITDEIPQVNNSIIYYRLKQVDLDGRKTYSLIKIVRIKKDTRSIIVSPNPFTSYLNLNIVWTANEMVDLKVFDVSGKVITQKNVIFLKGFNFISLNDLIKLPAGNYFISVASTSKKITLKIIKN